MIELCNKNGQSENTVEKIIFLIMFTVYANEL